MTTKPDDAKLTMESLKQAAESEDRHPLAGDAKPDPLEELSQLWAEMRDDVHFGWKLRVHAAIAAWEKERAELIHQRREATRQVERNAALRAAIYDALDAALRGER